MKKCVVVFFEGETEEEFYSRLFDIFKNKLQIKSFPFKLVKVPSLRGITNFENKLINKFKNEIKSNYGECDITVVLCYDTDVFEFNPHPPVNWIDIENKLLKAGAKKIVHCRAKVTIEDYFMKDIEGLCKYLKIKVPKKLEGRYGLDKIKVLFKKGNRNYTKGHNVKKFIDFLDMEKILEGIYADILDLCEEFGYKE